jgi:hypothetical protein
MKTLKFAIMAAMFVALSATSAKADGTNLVYTLTQVGSSTPLATWDMPLNPTPSCDFSPPEPCFTSGDAFFFTTDVSIDGGAPVTDTLVFLNTTPMSVDLNDFGFLIPELTGPQLYSGDESSPTMIIPASGFFTLIDDGANNPATAGTEYTLSVSQTPEPATLLLLGSGLLAFGMRKRRAAR